MPQDRKDTLVERLQAARDAMLWKLDGLTEHDVRRPLTPTGTNLLGLVEHLAGVELGYVGDTFDRPHGIHLPWLAATAEPDADMWARPDESRDAITGLDRPSYVERLEAAAGAAEASPPGVPPRRGRGQGGLVTPR